MKSFEVIFGWIMNKELISVKCVVGTYISGHWQLLILSISLCSMFMFFLCTYVVGPRGTLQLTDTVSTLYHKLVKDY